MEVQHISLSITNPATTKKVVFQKSLLADAHKIKGIGIKSGPSGDSTVTMRVKNEALVEEVPLDALQSNSSYVAPDDRFLTHIPQVEGVRGEKITIDLVDDGTAGSYPYTANIYLLIETKEVKVK